jgi:hypothetical protein
VLACEIVLSISLVHFSFFFGSGEGKLTVKGVFVGKEAAMRKAKGGREFLALNEFLKDKPSLFRLHFVCSN